MIVNSDRQFTTTEILLKTKPVKCNMKELRGYAYDINRTNVIKQRLQINFHVQNRYFRVWQNCRMEHLIACLFTLLISRLLWHQYLPICYLRVPSKTKIPSLKWCWLPIFTNNRHILTSFLHDASKSRHLF